jgi:pyruvate/2-oxoglutarate dehydrogenase complex dihydrolipoamide acyltransferase (E2) component
VAASSWDDVGDASIYGWLDIDATAMLAYVAEVRKATGVHVTVTHLVGKAIALAFSEAPECNAYVSLGQLRRRSTVDVFFSVAVGDGKNLSGAKVERVDELTVPEIALSLTRTVERIRGRQDTDLQRSQSLLSSVPAPLLGAVMKVTAHAMYDLGIDLSWAGVPADPLGTVVVTNVGVLGVEQGFAPFMPQGRAAAMLTVGKIRDKVIAIDGQARVRPVLTLGGTFDHRVIDGFHLGRMTRTLHGILGDPGRFLAAGHKADESPPASSRRVA